MNEAVNVSSHSLGSKVLLSSFPLRPVKASEKLRKAGNRVVYLIADPSVFDLKDMPDFFIE